MELELNEEEAAIVGDALLYLIPRLETDDDTQEVATGLYCRLLTMVAGHSSDWGDAEQEFTHQGVEPCTTLTNDPINW